ncbi:histidinol-phosphate transaminase [Candidatus Magnetominusculus xianensis]|uniref:Histidinol-phosphate aminotransferase n=1 Tax=Candidatus Magnetominusculus xianensis TaxID=1748249 RepID=A0ABR5SHN1_9BACT|nr:histidinol-phosphate transaminase [Candidatus Magnetominusculus xianensis]KWT88507.1 histidinol-phosphate aminotransferase [Candidatus Magnetominusculus xianensis]MBF0404422.1 histidinol-phosphate transaminase [Nitrospirota bacterium]
MIEDLIKPNIKALKAYTIEATPCSIRLDANESPYGFPLGQFRLPTNRYPDPDARSLRRFLAEKWGVEPECILHGNGSDELIYYLLTAIGGPALIPAPTFSMYRIIAESLGEKNFMVALDEQFDLDMEPMLAAIKQNNPKLIFLSRPNNPTGNSFTYGKVIEIIEKTGGLVILDEAYQPFSTRGDSFVDLLPRYRNLLVMRTLSKIGLAALRLGFLIGDKAIIEAVNKVRLPYNVNSLSQAAAIGILEDEKSIEKGINSVIDERDNLFAELSELDGIKAYSSNANFILFKLNINSPLTADALHKKLIEDDILIKKLVGGPLDNCFRVTVGTPKENAAFISSMKKIIEETNK